MGRGPKPRAPARALSPHPLPVQDWTGGEDAGWAGGRAVERESGPCSPGASTVLVGKRDLEEVGSGAIRTVVQELPGPKEQEGPQAQTARAKPRGQPRAAGKEDFCTWCQATWEKPQTGPYFTPSAQVQPPD